MLFDGGVQENNKHNDRNMRARTHTTTKAKNDTSHVHGISMFLRISVESEKCQLS